MSSNISRRRLLKGAGALASAEILLKLHEKSSAFPTDDNRARVLALIGDRYHNADYIRVALNRLFQDLNLPIDYTINYDQISARLLQSYSLFVVLRDGMIWPNGYLEPNDYEYSHELENDRGWPKEQSEPWITEEQGKAIKDFVEGGGGLYALHNSSHISLSSKDYREVMGGERVRWISLAAGLDVRHFAQRKGVSDHYFDSRVGRHLPRLPEQFCDPETPLLWGVRRRNACSRDCRRIWFSRGSQSPSRGLRKCADIPVGGTNRLPGSISEPAVSRCIAAPMSS